MALSAQNQSTSYVNLYYSIVQRAATRYFKEYYNSGEYQQSTQYFRERANERACIQLRPLPTASPLLPLYLLSRHPPANLHRDVHRLATCMRLVQRVLPKRDIASRRVRCAPCERARFRIFPPAALLPVDGLSPSRLARCARSLSLSLSLSLSFSLCLSVSKLETNSQPMRRLFFWPDVPFAFCTSLYFAYS